MKKNCTDGVFGRLLHLGTVEVNFRASGKIVTEKRVWGEDKMTKWIGVVVSRDGKMSVCEGEERNKVTECGKEGEGWGAAGWGKRRQGGKGKIPALQQVLPFFNVPGKTPTGHMG